MKYILDDKPIIKAICDSKLSLKDFARQMKMSRETLDNVLNGEPVVIQTVRKIANAISFHPDSLILASISTKESPISKSLHPLAKPEHSPLYYRQLKENRYSKWE